MWRTRTVGWSIALGAAILALRPVGPLERAAGVALIPTGLAGMFGAPARAVHHARHGQSAADAAGVVLAEAALSLALERAVLFSAWPRTVEIAAGIVPVPGEVRGRSRGNRDRIMLSVVSPERVHRGQPVVAGDVYVGSISRIPSRERRLESPGMLTRILRRLRLWSPPAVPPADLVEVQLITDPDARVGGLIEFDQDRRSCRLVAGGLAPMSDRIRLAIHNPESRATRSGCMVVMEPLGLIGARDGMAEGFLLGDLVTEFVQSEGGSFSREIQGVRPLVDFESGLNQLLVLTNALSADESLYEAMLEAVPVLEDGGWTKGRLSVLGDAAVWRSTAHLDLGKGAGVGRGAAVADGVRLVGRVSRSDQAGASVALLDDPGFRVDVLAQAVVFPDAMPLVLGTLESSGRDRTGRIVLMWRPQSSSRHDEWMKAVDPDGAGRGVDVRLWTGSGMVGVPRGLLVGRTVLTAPERPAQAARGGDFATGVIVHLALDDTGNPSAALQVRTGNGRHARRTAPAARRRTQRGVVHAADRPQAGVPDENPDENPDGPHNSGGDGR